MNILYLSYDGLTDPLGQSQILPYLTGLSKFGYKITIISAEKKENFTKRKHVIDVVIQEHNLTWQPVFYSKSPPIISTIWDIYIMQKKAFQLHKKCTFNIVHCRSYIAALVGLSLKRKKGVKFIFDMRGFWADERVDGGLWNMDNNLYRRIYLYFKSKEKVFLKEAHYTITLTHGAKHEIHSWPGLSQILIQVIPCCVDTCLFIPFTSKRSQDTRLNVEDADFQLSVSPFTVSYLGSLGTWYMLDEMLQFFKRLLLIHPDARFLFITPDNPQIIWQKIKTFDISADKISITKAERKDVPALLATSQLSIFFIKPAYSKKASSPTKMGEILSIGIPVICNKGIGDTEYLFEKYTPGILVENLKVESYDKAISQITKALQIPAQSLQNIALEYFDLKKGVDLYHQIYQKLLN